MNRHVRGTLFVDYVRMLRARKDRVWSNTLPPEDVAFLNQAIVADQWYPMATFELAYQMGPLAEEAASLQAMGFFERLLEVAGGRKGKVWFRTRSWAGDPATMLDMTWE